MSFLQALGTVMAFFLVLACLYVFADFILACFGLFAIGGAYLLFPCLVVLLIMKLSKKG